MEKQCPENCSNCKDNQACVPFFAHENALMHYGRVNKRSMVAIIAICITFVLLTAIFVTSYTVREKHWLETLSRIRQTPAVTEVQNGGVHEQQDP